MGYCTRCGQYFILSSGRPLSRTIGARGRGEAVTTIVDTVCPACLRPDEAYDQYGIATPKPLLEEMKYEQTTDDSKTEP